MLNRLFQNPPNVNSRYDKVIAAGLVILLFLLSSSLFGQDGEFLVTKGGDTIKVYEPVDSLKFTEFGRFYGVRVGIHWQGSWFEPFFRFKINDFNFWFIHFGLWDWKSDKQVEYYDYTTDRTVIPGKKLYMFGGFTLRSSFAHRVGQQIFADNFRPFVLLTAGVFYSYFYSYETKKFKDGFSRWLPLGGFEIGTYVGRDPQYIFTISVGVLFVPVLGRAVEIMEGESVKNFGSIYIAISLGSAGKQKK